MRDTFHGTTTVDFPRPLTTVDIVILTILDNQLQVLLVKRPVTPDEPFPDQWALPGGFVDVQLDRTLQDCALRKLHEKTGVRSPYLEQVGSWGSVERDPRGWSTTHVYVALLPHESLRLTAGGNTDQLCWMPVTQQGITVPLAFDHTILLQAALERVRGKTEYTSLPIHLLPDTFTLTELQQVYEVVLGRTLEKKAIRTRVLAAGILDETGDMKATSRRPAQLYRLKHPAGLFYFTRSFEAGRD